MIVSMTLRRILFNSGSRGRPGLVIAGGRLPLATFKRMTGRAIGRRCPGQVGQVLLLPRIARPSPVFRRVLEGVVQPAVPLRRHLARFRLALVDDPTPLLTALGPAGRPLITAALSVRRDICGDG